MAARVDAARPAARRPDRLARGGEPRDRSRLSVLALTGSCSAGSMNSCDTPCGRSRTAFGRRHPTAVRRDTEAVQARSSCWLPVRPRAPLGAQVSDGRGRPPRVLDSTGERVGALRGQTTVLESLDSRTRLLEPSISAGPRGLPRRHCAAHRTARCSSPDCRWRACTQPCTWLAAVVTAVAVVGLLGGGTGWRGHRPADAAPAAPGRRDRQPGRRVAACPGRGRARRTGSGQRHRPAHRGGTGRRGAEP